MIQQPAPGFTCTALMPDKEMQDISLSDYLGKWVVFFWYPLDFTFVCPTEIIAFGDRAPEFAGINTQVIAASCDSEFTHLAWVNTKRSDGGLGDMKIPIIADFSKEVAKNYGVLLPDGVPLRGLFIIDPKGILRQITCNDLPVGRNVDEILRLVKAFQFTDEHGEVCPANWQPGDLTMSADPIKSKEYFATVNDSSNGESNSVMEEVTDIASFNEIVSGSEGVTVVDYWAPWCKNCKKITPVLNKLALELPNTKFIQVNTVEAEELGHDQGIDALPTLHFFKAGVKIAEFKGSDLRKVEMAVRSACAL